jgi:hypothetical protein
LLKGSRIEPAGRLVIPARTENPEPGPWPGLDTRFRGYDTALLSFPRKAGIHRSLKALLAACLRGHDKGRGLGRIATARNLILIFVKPEIHAIN